jgi:hypothetical protein
MVEPSQVMGHFHHQLVFLHTSRQALLHFAIVENKKGGDTEDIEPGRNLGIAVDVELADPDFAFGLSGEIFDNRGDGAAGRTPWGPAEKQNRQRSAQHHFLEIGVRHHYRLGNKEFPGGKRFFALTAFGPSIDLVSRNPVAGLALQTANRVTGGRPLWSRSRIERRAALTTPGARTDFFTRDVIACAAARALDNCRCRFVHPSSFNTLTDSRPATVHENLFFVLEQFCQLSRLSHFCQIKDTIDIQGPKQVCKFEFWSLLLEIFYFVMG